MEERGRKNKRPGWNKIPCQIVYTNKRNTLDTGKGNATMKWSRLLAGAVCASLLSVPVWAVEGGEATTAGAGQTSSTACRVTLDGVCLDLSEAPAAPYQENGQVMLPLWKVAQALGWTVTWLPEENGTRIENEDQVMNLTYGLDRYACASKSSIGVISPEHYGAAPVVVAVTLLTE